MLTPEQITFAQRTVASVTGVTLPWPVNVLPAQDDTLTVELHADSASIRASSINELARGFFLLSRAYKEGWKPRTIRQNRHFASCGVMVDASRNAVPKVETVKRIIDQLASLGMNLLMLYTEDTYEVPEYPAFGYMRGRYTQKDLREIDDYAYSLGVELVPCIQTLGHLAQFLQWESVSHMGDNENVLLVDEPETYAFIEAEIRAVSCVRSRRIHIGMDEAHGVGLGSYYRKHGPTDRFQLLNRHLDRVVDICKQYDLSPIMWSDMFFRLGSKTNDYYDIESVVPDSVIATLPDVSLCYWDYYHDDEAFYDHMLTQHERMGRDTVFAGGIWTWSGFLPQIQLTRATMKPALRACAKHHTDTVFATMWGDDGAETNVQLGFSMLPMFSESCWQGTDVSDEELQLCGECLTGIPADVFEAWNHFYPQPSHHRPAKNLIWADPLYPLVFFPDGDSMPALLERSRKAAEALAPYRDSSLECRYSAALFDLCLLKGEMLLKLRDRYVSGDRTWLEETARVRIPALCESYDTLMRLHRTLWERDNRRFGWEVLSIRYGAAIGRLQDVQDELLRYLDGTLDSIEELDAEPCALAKDSVSYATVISPSKSGW